MTTSITYLGWDAFIVTSSGGVRILIDPFLSGNPPLGIPASPATVDTLEAVDAICVTHSAGDHLGDTFAILGKCDARLLCAPDIVFLAGRAGIASERIHVMVPGAVYQKGDVTVKALDSHHVSLKVLGEHAVSGPPLSYLVRTDDGFSAWHPGDTCIFTDMRLYGEFYHPDVAMLGIGGALLNGRNVAEMDPSEAAFAAKMLGVKVAIPMHSRFVEERENFVKELGKRAPEVKALVMKPLDVYTPES